MCLGLIVPSLHASQRIVNLLKKIKYILRPPTFLQGLDKQKKKHAHLK